MLSSLIFAALAAAWLVVLVPMFARRRQEVSKTTDSALAARVVRRGSGRRPAASAAQRTYGVEEAYGMPDTGQDDVDVDEYQDDGGVRSPAPPAGRLRRVSTGVRPGLARDATTSGSVVLALPGACSSGAGSPRGRARRGGLPVSLRRFRGPTGRHAT